MKLVTVINIIPRVNSVTERHRYEIITETNAVIVCITQFAVVSRDAVYGIKRIPREGTQRHRCSNSLIFKLISLTLQISIPQIFQSTFNSLVITRAEDIQ